MDAIKDVVVLADGGPEDAGTIEYAARLAGVHEAHLTGAFVFPLLRAAGPDAFVAGAAIRQLVESLDSESVRLERAAHACFERAAGAAGVATEWRTIRSLSSQEFVTHARYADIAVVSRPVRGGERGCPVALAQSLVFASGRPVILVPPRAPSTTASRVLVGWSASREATRAVADALPLLARAHAVQLLVIDPDPRVERHGQAPGSDIARHLARHGVSVEVRVVASDGHEAASLLLALARAFGSDLVVIGAYGHSRLSELVFGGVTRTALREADLPVLMSR